MAETEPPESAYDAAVRVPVPVTEPPVTVSVATVSEFEPSASSPPETVTEEASARVSVALPRDRTPSETVVPPVKVLEAMRVRLPEEDLESEPEPESTPPTVPAPTIEPPARTMSAEVSWSLRSSSPPARVTAAPSIAPSPLRRRTPAFRVTSEKALALETVRVPEPFLTKEPSREPKPVSS